MNPTKGDLNTIAGGFSGRGPTSFSHKRYARTIMSISRKESIFPANPPITFTKDDFDRIEPHEDDPMVIIIATVDY